MADFGADLAPLASDLIAFFGGDNKLEFAVFDSRSPKASNPRAQDVATGPGSVISARVTVLDRSQSTIENLKTGDRELLIEAEPFTDQNLDSNWHAREVGGDWYPLLKASSGKKKDRGITALQPGSTVVFYRAIHRRGSS